LNSGLSRYLDRSELTRLKSSWLDLSRVATSVMWKNGMGGQSTERASTMMLKASRGMGKWGEGIPSPSNQGI